MRAGCSWSTQMPAAREARQLPQHKVNIDPPSALARSGTPAAKQNKAQRVPPAPPLCASSLKIIIIKLFGLLGLCWKPGNTREKSWRKRAPAALLFSPYPSLPPLTQHPSKLDHCREGTSLRIPVTSPAPRRARSCQSRDMGTGSAPGT